MMTSSSLSSIQQIESISRFIPEAFRAFIEENYYSKINQKLILENVVHDPTFLQDPLSHLALFTDHGIVHVRNVAQLIIQVLETINGVHFPYRSSKRLDSMKAYGVMITYLHDIGMVDCSLFGRAVHAAFMAHEIFSPAFDEMIQILWDHNVGNIPARLVKLVAQEKELQPPIQIFREALSLAYCHSKSSIPIDILNDSKQLRKALQECLECNLEQIFYAKQIKQLTKNPSKRKKLLEQAKVSFQKAMTQEKKTGERRAKLSRYYQDFPSQSFRWLLSDSPNMKEWIKDIIDTLRGLRCADALRQRGTALKTSGNYQIFINQFTANPVFAITNKEGQIFLLEGQSSISSAEANLASADFVLNGDLLFSFFRGSFANEQAMQKAIKSLAILVNDIYIDVLDSFRRTALCRAIDKCKTSYLLLEETKDNPEFTNQLAQEIVRLEPKLEQVIKVFPALHVASERERSYYLAGLEVKWTLKRKRDFLAKIAEKGQKVCHIDLKHAFHQTRIISLRKGQILTQAGEPAEFVYIPFSNGLKGLPQGGYNKFKLLAWTPLGTTGVIRGDIRNATVVAEKRMELIMIPQHIYLKYWYHTYTSKEFIALVKKTYKKNK